MNFNRLIIGNYYQCLCGICGDMVFRKTHFDRGRNIVSKDSEHFNIYAPVEQYFPKPEELLKWRLLND